jgi:hypothetical protein
MIELTEMPHDGWIECDFFFGLTKRSNPEFLPRLLTTARETHLAAMTAKRF